MWLSWLYRPPWSREVSSKSRRSIALLQGLYLFTEIPIFVSRSILSFKEENSVKSFWESRSRTEPMNSTVEGYNGGQSPTYGFCNSNFCGRWDLKSSPTAHSLPCSTFSFPGINKTSYNLGAWKWALFSPANNWDGVYWSFTFATLIA